MATRVTDIEQQLWRAADELRANSNLSAQQYSVPVLGLIFLRYADFKFSRVEPEVEQELAQMSARRRARVNVEELYQARGVMFVPDEARFERLVQLPEGANIGRAVIEAMKAIEKKNPQLKDVLPKTYNRFRNDTLMTLLKNFNSVPMDIEGDAFGRIYEYFLGNFAMSEGQRGGQFFTPTSIVRLIVEIIEPYRGRILDPACGSGGMFVQSARFVEEHRNGAQVPGTSGNQVPGTSDEQVPGTSGPKHSAATPETDQMSNTQVPGTLSIHGQERINQTVRLCLMNLAVHGLEGDIRQSNSYYDNPFNMVDKFDFVMANPPFNVNNVNMEDLKGDRRFPFGLPNVDNANYIWIQMFYSALNESGRAGFVMANSAADARHSEQAIREKLIRSGAVDVMVAVGSNFFYTVTLPCTLWFLDKGKVGHKVPGTSEPKRSTPAPKTGQMSNTQVPGTSSETDQMEQQVPGTSGPKRSTPAPKTNQTTNTQVPGTLRSKETVLFIDARKIYRQVTRAVRDFTEEQLRFIADIARLYRGEPVDVDDREIPVEGGWGTATTMEELFPQGRYRDVPGLCKVATRAKIEAQGWSLNPGRYVGVAARSRDDFDFYERFEELHEELELLNVKARDLEEQITENAQRIFEGSVN